MESTLKWRPIGWRLYLMPSKDIILVIQETFEIIFALITAFVFFFRVQLFTFLGANVVSLLVI
jgi:hypothetical protein